MSFKKTQDGRVFFKNQSGSANDRGDSARRAVTSRPVISDSNISTVQILALLKSLNEKLVKTQSERKSMRAELAKYRSIVENMQQSDGVSNAAIKADRAERTAQDVIKELEAARRMMAQIENKADRADQNAMSLKAQILEARQGQKLLLNKQTEFEQKLDDTQVQQTRVLRQIDKVTEDRSRFMRKIERIEEAVLQTQDALNAKAMVLLTDQGLAGQDTSLDLNEDGYIIPQKKEEYDGRENVQSVPPSASQAQSKQNRVILSGLVAAGFIAIGLGLFYKQNSNVHAPYVSSIEKPVRIADSDIGTRFQDVQRLPLQQTPKDTQTARPPVNLGDMDAEQPVNLNNDAQVLDLIETNPEKLGNSLNALEPSVIPEDIASVPIEKPSIEPVQTIPTEIFEKPELAIVRDPVKPITEDILPFPVGRTVIKPTNLKPDSRLPVNIQPIEAEALGGSAEAQHDLAAIYISGHGGVEKNYKRAANWFELAAQGGVANASYNLGVLHHQGLGLDRDVEQALSWYQKAATQNHPEAQYNLGIAYIEGIGVPYDVQKASRYFENAANQGVIEAAYNLGLIYENGLLGTPQPDEALMWYKTAADQGSPEAKQALEQLAQTLEIDIEAVNRIADGMKKAQKKTKVTASAPKTRTPEIRTQPNPAPIVTAPTNNKRVIIAQIQDYLIETGLYPGPASGQMNPMMSDAIRIYQRDNSLKENGHADRELLVHMLGNEDYTGVGSRLR